MTRRGATRSQRRREKLTTANIYLSPGPIPPDQVTSPHSQFCSNELDRTSVTVVQGQFENTVTEVEEEVQIRSQINVELECAVPSCNFDGHGTKYKTPPLLHHQALQLLERHSWSHEVQDLRGAGVVSDHDVQVDAIPEPVCKPVLLRGCSVGESQSFQVDKDTEVEVEDTPMMVCRPVLPRGCSLEQFKSFHMAWSAYAEEFRSQFEETYREVDKVRLNYLLNYELLSSIPTSLEHAIYRTRAFMVDMVPMAALLLDIKRNIVEEAVKRAQESVVQSTAEVTGIGVKTVIDVVVKDNTGGQGGGAKQENPKSVSHCGEPCQEQLGGGFKMDHEQGEVQHHRPELCGRKEDTEISGKYHDKETIVGYSKKKKKKRQNVKRNDILQLSVKYIQSVYSVKESSNIDEDSGKSVKMKSQIAEEIKIKTYSGKLQYTENVDMKRVNTPSRTSFPRGLGEGVDAGHVNSAPLSLSPYGGPGAVTEVKQQEGEENNSDQLSIYPEPERINSTDNFSKSMTTKVPDKDPPDRPLILSVCQIQDEVQHVLPVQPNLEAGDLAAEVVQHVPLSHLRSKPW